ncbi:LEPR-XLL domain-containing protein, partial [Caballeronia mineralivorans]
MNALRAAERRVRFDQLERRVLLSTTLPSGST